MTNEEKAREILECNFWIDNVGTQTDTLARYIDLNKMAEWKDEQINEGLNLITDWFEHIAQIANDKKTLNGVVMKDSDAFDEIKCLAKRCAEYVDMRLLNI